MARLFVYAAALAALAAPALAGLGYSTLRLNPCGTSTAVGPYQAWTYTNNKLSIASTPGMLWGGHAGVAAIQNEQINATLWATPGGDLALQFATDGSQTQLVATKSGLCAVLLGPALPGAQFWLQPCATSNDRFTWSAAAGTLTHVASGMCLDAGSQVPPCSAGSPGASLPFCNVTLPISARVADLVSRLSVEEMQNMLDTSSGGSSALGIPPYQWWNEALHGIANNVGVGFLDPTPFSTSFPMAITSSCAFNTSLWHAIGAAISDEGRAFANQGHTGGLTFWTPTINMFRDPRWGRGQETPGEDPLVTGAYATQYVRGMQAGSDPRYLKVSSCCKHFAAYSLELWNGTDRHHFNAVVDDSDLVDYYLQPFQSCVQQGRASAIMCSYNALNGVPTCANDFLLTTVLRDAWQFDGYVTSDCGAVSDIQFAHGYTSNTDQTAAATLKAGMDIGCDGYLAGANVISTAVTDGAISTADLTTAMTHLFSVRFRLGEFDPDAAQPYKSIPPTVACSADHQALAQDAARQSIVLLANKNASLPVNKAKVGSVAVIGPLADNTYINGGPNYNGVPCGGAPSTVKTAFQAVPGLSVNYVQGCDSVQCNSNAGFASAVAAAQAADLTVVAVGIDATFENEGLDRINIDLPGQQNALVQQVCAAAKGPCILAVVSGGAQDVSALIPSVSGAFYLGLPGGFGANAFVDLVFGAAAPAGRMTQTTYPASYTTAVSLEDMGLKPGPSAFPPGTNPGRTYMYYTGQAVFPFGFGLSYTTWAVNGLTGPSSLSLAPVHDYLAAHKEHGAAFAPQDSPLVASYNVNVTNTGGVDSDYVVLGFTVPPGAGTNGVPLQELFGFERVHVPAGQTVTVYLGLHARDLTHVVAAPDMETTSPLAPKARRVALPGAYTIRVGVKAEGQEWTEAPLLVTV